MSDTRKLRVEDLDGRVTEDDEQNDSGDERGGADFDEVYAALDKDVERKDDQRKDQPAAGDAGEAGGGKAKDQPAQGPVPEVKAEVFELSKLEPAKRQEVDQLLELQGLIMKFSNQLRFESPEAREAFMKKLQSELGQPTEGTTDKFGKLPEFGAATKEGFAKLSEFFTKGAVPNAMGALDTMQLALPPGMPLKIAGRNETILRTNEQFRQEVAQGRAYLDIDTNRLDDVRKLRPVTDWLDQAGRSLQHEHNERLERYLANKVEEGIRQGRFPEGWRRPEGMDKQTWSSAVEQTMDAYTRTTRVIEAINHLERSKLGFRSDALANLPPEVKVTRDPVTGRVTDVNFGQLMVEDLSLQSDVNRQKLDKLKAWCDKYEGPAQKGMHEILKDQIHIPGYGEAEVHKGWINPTTKEFVFGRDQSPGSGWQRFNMISYDMDVKETKDEFGRVKEVTITPDMNFQEVPWFGYLNTLGDVKHREKGQPVTYKADDWVAVQTGPGQVEMMQAKDVKDWRDRQQLKLYAGKAITFTMDAAMIVSGTIELRAAAKVAQLGVREAVSIGGQVLKTEMASQIPKHVISRQVMKGAFEVGLGLTGVFHNAGAHEVPWMKGVSDLRTAYFLGHAGYSLAHLARLPQAGKALAEAASPRVAGAAGRVFESIAGSEATVRSMELAKAGALSKMWKGWYGMDEGAAVAFNVSEKAFIGMFMWDFASMYHKSQQRTDVLRQAARALDQASLKDNKALENVMANAVRPSETTEQFFKRYKSSLGDLNRNASDTIDGIIAKVKELQAPGAKEEDRQKYVQELMQHLRFEGKKIASLQNGRNEDRQHSEATLNQMAQTDDSTLNPNVRRMAALAMLSLTRKPDGSWAENVTERKVKVDDYEVTWTDGEGHPHSRKVTGPEITQKIPAAELVEVLQSDLRRQTDAAVRTEKAAALHEVGLVPSEQVADLLLSRIEGKDGSDKQTRMKAVIDFAGLVSRLKVEESMRANMFNDREQFLARGLTLGLTSADLLKRLEQAAIGAQDKDLKATALFAQSLLRRETMDDVDKKRLTDALFKDPPGVTEAGLKAMLEADADARPQDKAGWERKLVAANILSSLAQANDAVDSKAVAALRDCMKTGAPADIAVKALQALTTPVNGLSIADQLEFKEPDKRWKKTILAEGFNIFNDIQDKPAADLATRIETAKAREALINTITPLVKFSDDPVLKRQLVGQLTTMVTRQGENIEEVRVAAIKGLVELGARDKDTIDAIKRNLAVKDEPQAAVRMAAVDAIERLVVRARERKDILGPLAASEPDQAIKTKLARYFRAQGTILDAGSQASDQAVAEARTEQNRDEIKPTEVHNWIKNNAATLLAQNNIFDYMNPNSEQVRIMRGMTSLSSAWQSAIDSKNESAWWPGYAARRKWGEERLYQWELVAQNKAFAAYGRGVDDLVNKAMTGSTAKNIRMGDQMVSEREAAVLALGSLVSGGSRMGDPYYKHRDKDELSASNLSYKPYDQREARIRSEFSNATGWDGKRLDYEIYTSDPWPRMEQAIATKLSELASASKDTVNLKLLTEQLFVGLESKDTVSDKSRATLVQGLDRLLSRPETDPEVKRDIVRRVAKMVHDMKEVDQNKAQGMVAMLDLLDKHGKRAFEQFSTDYAYVRTALQARSQMESFRTPPEVRVKAQELYDRQWQSVTAEQSVMPPGSGTARARSEQLPKDLDLLEKANTTDGRDERVHDAVQQILSATRGMPLRADDPRRAAIEALTESKYDDRVRVAAYTALAESEQAQDRQTAAYGLWSIGIESDVRALRHDAARLLEKLPAVMVSEGDLEKLRQNVYDRVAAATGQNPEALVGKSQDEIVAMANTFITEKRQSANAQEKQRAAELLQSMHRWGESLALAASMKMRYREQGTDSVSQAEPLYRRALAAMGVDQKMVSDWAALARSNSHHPIEYELDGPMKTLLAGHQETGATPALVRALAGYGKLTAARLTQQGVDLTLTADTAIALASATTALARKYYPEHAYGRGEAEMLAGAVHQQIGQSRLTSKERWQGHAANYYDNARKQFEQFKKSRPEIVDAGKWQGEAHESFVQASVERFATMAARKDRGTYLQSQLTALSGELDKELEAYKDKASYQYHAHRFVKAWIDTSALPEADRAAARTRAEDYMKQALEAASRQHGPESPQYELMLRKVWQYHNQQQQADKAEDFFKKALDAAPPETQKPLRAALLKQYHFFLKNAKRDTEANEIGRQYHALVNGQ